MRQKIVSAGPEDLQSLARISPTKSRHNCVLSFPGILRARREHIGRLDGTAYPRTAFRRNHMGGGITSGTVAMMFIPSKARLPPDAASRQSVLGTGSLQPKSANRSPYLLHLARPVLLHVVRFCPDAARCL